MEVEGTDPDFDPTTEEGQADINDGDEEPLLPIDDSLRDRITKALRHPKAREYTFPREHIELQNMGEPAGETVEWAMRELNELYPHLDDNEIRLTEEGNKVLISVKDMRSPDKDRWTKPQALFDENGAVKNNVERLRGFQAATRSMLDRLEALTERVTTEKRAEELQKALEEKEAAYEKQSQLLANAEKKFSQQDVRMEEMAKHLDQALRDRDKAERELEEAKKSHAPTAALEKALKEKETSYKKQLQQLRRSKDENIRIITRETEKALDERDRARQAFRLALQDLNMSQEEVRNLQSTIEGSLEERRQLVAEINTKEEQIRQREQAIEDLEGEIER
ncbi:uncharacterized protein LOC116308941, partial [Actinia tenebrosa]|uniref:Uncharacterized protein LOC116308941 n=1 Tax=Actinia tenebrosa TaxID=6105 RepID=A0A6P8JGA5_ACTTE